MPGGRLLLLLLLLLLPSSPALGCEVRRRASLSVVQHDESGRACWGRVAVSTCWGHCSSHEVPDWRFPYKRSYHPVCLHRSVRLRSVTLSHCDDGVTPGTERHVLLDAVVCRCALCHSALASCQSELRRGTQLRLSRR